MIESSFCFNFSILKVVHDVRSEIKVQVNSVNGERMVDILKNDINWLFERSEPESQVDLFVLINHQFVIKCRRSTSSWYQLFKLYQLNCLSRKKTYCSDVSMPRDVSRSFWYFGRNCI